MIPSVQSHAIGVATIHQGANAPGGSSLLPSPSATAVGLDDMSLLYLVQSKERQLGLANGKQQIDSNQRRCDDAFQQRKKQLDDAAAQAAEAARHHSFWDSIGSVFSTVAKVAAIVASVAVAVVSLGAATPIAALAIAGAALSLAASADSQFHILEKLGVDPSVAGWIDMGCAIGGALATGGASALSTASLASSIGKLASATQAIAAGGAGVASGVDHIEQAQYKGKEQDDFAGALHEQQQMQALQRKIQELLEELQGDDKDAGRRLGHIQDAMQTRDACLSAAVSMRV